MVTFSHYPDDQPIHRLLSQVIAVAIIGLACESFGFSVVLAASAMATAWAPSDMYFQQLLNYLQSRSHEVMAYVQKQIPDMTTSTKKAGGPSGFTFVSPRDAKEAAANAFSQKKSK